MTRPTEVTDSEYIFEEDSKIAESYNGLEVDGEWIMFFSFSNLDEKWNLACELYRSRKLVGVHSMKVSTKKRREDVEHESSAITFHCGPSSDKSAMIACGKNIVEKFNYSHPLGFIGYKTNAQTEFNEATGKLGRNCTYKIPVPFAIGDDDHWLVDYNLDYVKEFGEPDGFWSMHFHISVMEEKWQLARDLFRKGELAEISYLRCLRNADSSDTVHIHFLSKVANDRSLMLRYGDNLVNKMQCTYPSGHIKFEFDDTRTSIKGGYKIPVPFGSSEVGDWLVQQNPDYIEKYGEPDGFWKMYFKYSVMEEKWQLACDLFRNGQLDGISYMRRTQKSASFDTGFIDFLCGPSNDRSLMLKYGQNLVQKLQYTNSTGNMKFEFDDTRTNLTGGYQIPVNLGSSDNVWHVEENLDYIREYGEFDGSWVLAYTYSELEEKWMLACELFKNGELDGISCMKCPKKKAPSRNIEFMFFYCGPSSNKSLILRYGRNLVDKLQYTGSSGHVRFNFDVLRTGNKGFYKIPV